MDDRTIALLVSMRELETLIGLASMEALRLLSVEPASPHTAPTGALTQMLRRRYQDERRAEVTDER